MNFKKIFSIMILFLILMNPTSSFAVTDINYSDNYISETEKQTIYQMIEKQLISTYGDDYKFEDFEFRMKKEKELEQDIFINIDVSVEMTLKKSVKENAFIQGMMNEINLLNHNEKNIALKSIEPLVSDIEEAYNKPRKVSVLYTANLDKKNRSERNIQLFSRIDLSEGEYILTSVDKVLENKIKNEKNAFENGKSAIKEITYQSNMSTLNFKSNNLLSSVRYDRIAAAKWAKNHREDTPEYSAAIDNGSDCANFVSKAINSGGIPQDVYGKWAHYSNGSTIGAYKYINWFRTGFNNNGGVATYMENKGYFYKEDRKERAFAGSIIFNTSKSHVGLVTAGDGMNVFYADHSDVKKYGKETLLQIGDSSFESFTFYIPSTSILN